jgi:hypothetical protein
VFFLFFFGLGVYEDIINKNDDKLVKILQEHLIHVTHEIGGGICQYKGHHGVLVQSVTGGEAVLGMSLSLTLSW